jgi:hypothetical protein
MLVARFDPLPGQSLLNSLRRITDEYSMKLPRPLPGHRQLAAEKTQERFNA